MNFLGKILGFFIGYRIGGLFGAILGALLGHWGDKKLYELGSVRSSYFGKSLTRQSLFIQTSFAVLGHLNKSKGRVTEQDIKMASDFMDELHLDETNRKLAQSAFSRGKEADFPVRDVVREFRIACGQRADLLRIFLEIQIQSAFVDGILNASEKELLFAIAEELGMSRPQFEQKLAMVFAAQQFSRHHYQHAGNDSYHQSGYQQQYNQQQYYQHRQQNHYRSSQRPTVDDAYKVLGVSASDDRNTVKRAYRRLMNEHHPDKLVAKGLPQEMMEIAKEKAQQIQAAYDLICKSKGWK